MIKRIIFDIDNTLMDFPKNYEIYYQRVLDKYKVNVSARDLYNTIGKYETCDRYVFYDRKILLELINKELNLNLDNYFLNDFFQMYNHLITNIDESTKKTLEYLKAKYELVTLSNWFTSCQKERLTQADIIDYFDKVYGTDIIPMKPYYESYLSVTGNRKLEECLMVGDNINIDIKTPNDIGMKVYYLGKKKTKYPTINKIEDLKKLL